MMGSSIFMAISGIMVVLIYILFSILPEMVDKTLNSVEPIHLFEKNISSKNLKIHWDLNMVTDMHADSLLWKRSLNPSHGERSLTSYDKKFKIFDNDFGHVSIHKLLQGNVALQSFSCVSSSPVDQNHLNSKNTSLDNVRLLSIINNWPVKTWNSLLHRCLYQSEVLHSVEKQFDTRTALDHSAKNGAALVNIPIFRILKFKKDFESYLKDRNAIRVQIHNKPSITAGILSIEGLHCLNNDINNLKVLYDAGYRVMALTHFFDNELGGSLHGINKYGLTKLGTEILVVMNALQALVEICPNLPVCL